MWVLLAAFLSWGWTGSAAEDLFATVQGYVRTQNWGDFYDCLSAGSQSEYGKHIDMMKSFALGGKAGGPDSGGRLEMIQKFSGIGLFALDPRNVFTVEMQQMQQGEGTKPFSELTDCPVVGREIGGQYAKLTLKCGEEKFFDVVMVREDPGWRLEIKVSDYYPDIKEWSEEKSRALKALTPVEPEKKHAPSGPPGNVSAAAAAGDLQALKALAADRAAVEKSGGVQILFGKVVKSGHVDCAEYLIARGADVNKRDFDGYLPLRFALGNDRMVECFLKQGAKPDARVLITLMDMIDDDFFRSGGNDAVEKKIMAAFDGTKDDQVRAGAGRYADFLGTRSELLMRELKLLIDSLNGPDDSAALNEALRYAAVHGNKKVVGWLVDRGADPAAGTRKK